MPETAALRPSQLVDLDEIMVFEPRDGFGFV